MIAMRPYIIKDFAPLSQTIHQVCFDSPWMSTRSFLPTNSWIHAMQMDGCQDHRLLVAESNGTVVGWCRSFPPACGEVSAQAELGIGLLAPYRNQGIGTELVMRSLEWADLRGLRKVDLMVSIKNIIAVHVFEKCGFKTIQLSGNKMMMSICLS